MPSAETILQGLTTIANDWRFAAIVWHVLLVALLLAIHARRVSNRPLGYLLVVPLTSVSALAWAAGNPFNGVTFAALAALLVRGARRLPMELRVGSVMRFRLGALLLLFGWIYPHFVEVANRAEYLVVAPLGLLPCPTLSALIGLTLMFDLDRAPGWGVPLAIAGIAYGAIGVWHLGVTLDAVLLAGAAVLAVPAVGRMARWRSVRATGDESARPLPGDGLISAASGSVTHAITIPRPRADVWPWLAQMGAGSRAGWYSYDLLDNKGQPSADRIVPALQQLKVGMIFPALPGVTDCFTLLDFEPERFLILGWLSPDCHPRMTWAFVLEEHAPGGTRLLVRARTDSTYAFGKLPKWMTTPVGSLVHFVMQRKQLLGVARRIARA